MRHLASSCYTLDKYTFDIFTLFHVSRANFVQVGNPVDLQIPVPIMTLEGYKKWQDEQGAQKVQAYPREGMPGLFARALLFISFLQQY